MTADRFGTDADRYDAARPAYPDEFVRAVIDALPPDEGVVLDVGAGTGILTRQFSAALPNGAVLGVEPSDVMRAEAERVGGGRYAAGTAEALPAGDGTARAVVAGAAAHWFDRPAFYREARRVLASGGVLAVLDYPRDETGSSAAVETFLRRFGRKAYKRPNYADELTPEIGFALEKRLERPVVDPMTPAAFVDLVLSSSHARAVEAALGVEAARRTIEVLAADLTTGDGVIPYGYVFRLFLARRI